LHALLSGHMRQRGNHIVRFNTRHIQQRPTHQFDKPVYGLDLAAQVIRHGRTRGLVVGIYGVAKRRSFGIEHTHRMRGGPVATQAGQHIDHAADRTGGLAVGVIAICAQIGHGMKGAVKVT